MAPYGAQSSPQDDFADRDFTILMPPIKLNSGKPNPNKHHSPINPQQK
jgi:hypothetical protein